jgi:hypothetical protein
MMVQRQHRCLPSIGPGFNSRSLQFFFFSFFQLLPFVTLCPSFHNSNHILPQITHHHNLPSWHALSDIVLCSVLLVGCLYLVLLCVAYHCACGKVQWATLSESSNTPLRWARFAAATTTTSSFSRGHRSPTAAARPQQETLPEAYTHGHSTPMQRTGCL